MSTGLMDTAFYGTTTTKKDHAPPITLKDCTIKKKKRLQHTNPNIYDIYNKKIIQKRMNYKDTFVTACHCFVISCNCMLNRAIELILNY